MVGFLKKILLVQRIGKNQKFVFDNKILGRWVGSISEGKLDKIIEEILRNDINVEFGENIESFRSLN